MLQAQVNYWANQTTRWHNQAMEEQARNELKETVRSHQAQENISMQNYFETVRHNAAMEAETRRSNMAQENLKLQAQLESQRHNIQSEILSNYSNISNRMSAQATQANANTNRLNANTQAFSARVKAKNDSRNAITNEMNANTNFMNAQTNVFNAQTKSSQVKREWNESTYNNIGKVTKSISDVFSLWK